MGLPGWLRVLISIHALLAESDSQSSRTGIGEQIISIHALLAESDVIVKIRGSVRPDISIHALLAESDKRRTCQRAEKQEFLSTLSLRRATHYDNYNLHCVEISIHALLAESDSQWMYHSTKF